jgi:hypothetical protein
MGSCVRWLSRWPLGPVGDSTAGCPPNSRRAGHDVSSALWSARLLRDDPPRSWPRTPPSPRPGRRWRRRRATRPRCRGFRRRRHRRDRGPPADRVVGGAAARGRGTAGSPGSVRPVRRDARRRLRVHRRLREAPCRSRDLRALPPAADGAARRARGADVLACETVPAAAEAEALIAEADRARRAGLALAHHGASTSDGVVRTGGASAPRTCSRWRRVSCGDRRRRELPRQPSAVAASWRGGGRGKARFVAYPNSGEGWDAAASGLDRVAGDLDRRRARLGRRRGAVDRGLLPVRRSTSRRSRRPSPELPFPGKRHLGEGAFSRKGTRGGGSGRGG